MTIYFNILVDQKQIWSSMACESVKTVEKRREDTRVCDLVVVVEAGQHDDDGRVLLPHHPPEVIHRLFHGRLGRYVTLRVTLVALKHTIHTAFHFLKFNGNEVTGAYLL